VSSGVKVEGLVGMERTSAEAMIEVLADTSWRQRELRVLDNKVRMILFFRRKGMVKVAEIKLDSTVWLCRQGAKVSQEVSYISLLQLAPGKVYHERRVNSSRGDQGSGIKQPAEWTGNWRTLSPVSSMITHNHSCPLPTVALHTRSKSKHLNHSQQFQWKSVEGSLT
jgi:hypothetical protein